MARLAKSPLGSNTDQIVIKVPLVTKKALSVYSGSNKDSINLLRRWIYMFSFPILFSSINEKIKEEGVTDESNEMLNFIYSEVINCGEDIEKLSEFFKDIPELKNLLKKLRENLNE